MQSLLRRRPTRIRRAPVRRALAVLSVLGAVVATLPAGTAAAAAPAQVVPVAPNDSPATIIANAANVVPSPRQLAWQRLERMAFIHFGVNTFTGREWGTGTEDPNVFQPTGLNTDQWAASLKEAGFKGGILTAKHHDGFVLFPSRYTTFDVASDLAWQNGNGDVMRNFADSMHKYGLKVGVYLSPADLHENLSGGKFANGSPQRQVTIPSNPADVVNGVTFTVNADDYNAYFENTLYEVMSRYGTIDEVWWDMANPTGRYQPYNFLDWIRIVRTLQPGAAMENDGGPDIRWIGNENGYARQSEWNVVPYAGNAAIAADNIVNPPGGNGAADLGSDALLSQRKADGTSAWNYLKWSPGECNGTLSARHNWFWQPNEVWRGVPELEDMYYGSVGRNCNSLLNVSPNRQGVLDQSAVSVLNQFNARLTGTFGTNLAAGATVSNDSGTSNLDGRTPTLALDGNLDTSWQPTATTGGLVFTLPAAKTFDVVSVQEDLNLGQRVKSYAVDAWNGTAWTQIVTDTTIGQKKLTRLSAPVTTSRVRLRVTGSRATPAIAEFGLFQRPGGGTPQGSIVGVQSGRCVDVEGVSTANGAAVHLWDCHGGSNQRWTQSGKQLVVYGNKCLDAYGAGTSPGTAAVIWDCHGGTNQQWNVNADGTITGVQSGLCLDAYGGGTVNGTKLVLWTCTGGANQKWQLR
ncbi:alpha-L-fucosidase [Saccharothrix variisporea]|uniref:alpha-L-fucosidase n=1 Tax=Saccharothrix variisporea TaxID=543527 RepID=A0A495XSZ0_9PSEU|nr:alpha-L-fucosidase [Saccharothrix variisporea]